MLNFLTDSLPGLALTAEPVGKTPINRSTKPPDEGIIAGGRGFFIMLTLALSVVVFVAIGMEKLWIRIRRLRLHLAVQFRYQLWLQLQACGQHGEIRLLGGGIH